MVCQSTSESNFSNPGGLSICSFFSLLSAAIVVVCAGSSPSEFLLFSKWRCWRSISRFSSLFLKLWRLFKLHRPGHVINFFSEMPKIFFLSSFSFTCFVKHFDQHFSMSLIGSVPFFQLDKSGKSQLRQVSWEDLNQWFKKIFLTVTMSSKCWKSVFPLRFFSRYEPRVVAKNKLVGMVTNQITRSSSPEFSLSL